MTNIIRIETGSPPVTSRDEYEAIFALGQEAATLADGATDPLQTFRRLRQAGVAALKTEQPPAAMIRSLRSWTSR